MFSTPLQTKVSPQEWKKTLTRMNAIFTPKQAKKMSNSSSSNQLFQQEAILRKDEGDKSRSSPYSISIYNLFVSLPAGVNLSEWKKSGKVWRPPFHSALSIIHSAAAGKSSSASARKVSPAWWTTASKYQPSSRVNFPDATPPENSTHTTS